jgi:hypothetical protein
VRQRVTRIFCGRKAGAIGGHWRGAHGRVGSISIVYFGLTLWWRTIPRRRTRSSTASSNSLLGWRGAHAVPVIYMRRELHRKWLDGDTPTTRSRPRARRPRGGRASDTTHPMPAKKRPHGLLIATRDPPDQHLVGGSLGRRCLCRRCGSPSHAGLKPADYSDSSTLIIAGFRSAVKDRHAGLPLPSASVFDPTSRRALPRATCSKITFECPILYRLPASGGASLL